jgi:predicted DNA binding CopG/RHH family protein
MKRKIRLDSFEKEIESHIDESVPITGEKRRRIETRLERSRKTKNINIRISEYGLTRLKLRAEEESMP